MRVLWIEDQQMIGDALELLLDVVMPDISLDKATNIETALQLVGNFRYELILADWWLGMQDGEATIRRLRAAGCNLPVIVVSGDEREPVRSRALELGVSGYVSKSAAPECLVAAIQRVVQGALTPVADTSAQRASIDGSLPPLNVESRFPDLTPRQMDVFRALARGVSNKQIARDLNISDTTVKTHVRAILQALGVSTRGEAVFAGRMRGVSGF